MESTALTATNGAKVAVAGTVPIKRKSRNALLKAHKVHLKAQEVDDDAARLVKQPIMEEAYHASARSIRDLSIVRGPPGSQPVFYQPNRSRYP